MNTHKAKATHEYDTAASQLLGLVERYNLHLGGEE
jgi:hypothetical protein